MNDCGVMKNVTNGAKTNESRMSDDATMNDVTSDDPTNCGANVGANVGVRSCGATNDDAHRRRTLFPAA